jgi:hypothetical protein
MCPVVLLDHVNVVRAEADIDDRSAGPFDIALIALAFSLALALAVIVSAHRGKTNTKEQRGNPPHIASLLPEGGTIDGEPAAAGWILQCGI